MILPKNPRRGADFSFWDGDINWDLYPFDFVVLKIGQGNWTDPKFISNYNGAKAKGIEVGGYWFYDGRYHPTEQLNAFKKAMTDKEFELEAWVDWERHTGQAYDDIEHVVEMLHGVEKLYKTGMYTGYYFFVEHTRADAEYMKYLSTLPLWLAWYGTGVRIPRPWTTWKMWQYGTPAANYGQQAGKLEVDMNLRNEESKEEPKVNVYTVRPGFTIRYRSAPNTGAVILGSLGAGSKVVGTLVNGWIAVDHGVGIEVPKSYMYYDPLWYDVGNVVDTGSVLVDHKFVSQLVLDGQTYEASFQVDAVEYKRI